MLIALLIAAGAMSAWLGTAVATTLACVTILIVGLPHGALDLDLIGQERGRGRLVVVGCYLAFAAAMAGLWAVEPVVALGAFLALSVVHFAEDWEALDSPFLAIGIALSLIALPALFHREALASLFVILTGVPAAARYADVLLLVVPIATVAASVGVACLWQAGHRRLASAAALSMVAMVALPPVVGFACFFCLFHSPHNLAGTFRVLGRSGVARFGGAIVPLSAAAGGLAVLIALVVARGSVGEAAVTASFMTLSILTLPHMAVPWVMRRVISQR